MADYKRNSIKRGGTGKLCKEADKGEKAKGQNKGKLTLPDHYSHDDILVTGNESTWLKHIGSSCTVY